jgi:NuA3 HAT complex component NTO1
LDNAILYNSHPGSIYHKLAVRIKKAAEPVFKSLLSEIRLLGDFPSTSGAEDMELEPSAASLRAMLEPGARDQLTLLHELFAYELEPPQPPTPPPKPKKKVDKVEAAARRQAKAAKYDEPRVAGRSTRHTVALGIDKLVEDAAEPTPSGDEVEDTGVRPASGDTGISGGIPIATKRLRPSNASTKAKMEDSLEHADAVRGRRSRRLDIQESSVSASASAESTATGSEQKARRKPERGVAGQESYSPLGPKERRERDKQMAMELVVENLDSRDDFKRFNVGWVLPEGTKRGGRRDRQMDHVPEGASKKRRCKCSQYRIECVTETFLRILQRAR